MKVKEIFPNLFFVVSIILIPKPKIDPPKKKKQKKKKNKKKKAKKKKTKKKTKTNISQEIKSENSQKYYEYIKCIPE